MGDLWDLASGRLERERSQEILRDKIPPTKGLSAETAAAIERGELAIVDDDS